MRPPAPLGLYVHVPFCEAKCTYCHFAIDPRRPDDARQDRYLRALLTELGEAEVGEADTLYFGGGTPSLMSRDRLGRIAHLARNRFSLLDTAEVTVEANPRDLDEAGYRALRALGANRLSLGVQSLDEGVLREMGRLHRASDSLRAVALARAAGFENVSVDLVLGWTGESRDRWRRTLDGVLAFEPEHLSLYVLEVEGRTVLTHRLKRGTLELPDEDRVADLYQETVERLEKVGLHRYEISNFARPGFQSRHNRKYWDEAPFLGFGMSAHSLRAGRRFWNHDRYATYCAAVEGGQGPRAGERVLTAREQAQEALITGLRRSEGVVLDGFRRRHGFDPTTEWAGPLEDVTRAGLLETASGSLRLTDRGMLLSNEVLQIFV